MYKAIKYIGTDYTPGEALPDSLDEALIKRLLKAGAIKETAPAPVPGPGMDAEPPHAEAPAEELEEPGELADTEEDYEEPEAPEVDVADALIAPAEPEEEAPKPAQRKRNTTAKGGKGK